MQSLAYSSTYTGLGNHAHDALPQPQTHGICPINKTDCTKLSITDLSPSLTCNLRTFPVYGVLHEWFCCEVLAVSEEHLHIPTYLGCSRFRHATDMMQAFKNSKTVLTRVVEGSTPIRGLQELQSLPRRQNPAHCPRASIYQLTWLPRHCRCKC